MSTPPAGYLLLEDGTVFPGRSVAAAGAAFGEVVFTTGMTGYQETVTDPSYAGQLVCFTAPMVGNYGVADARLESEAPHARAVLMRRLGGEDWALWLAERGIVALDEIDTRGLTLRLPSDRDRRSHALHLTRDGQKLLKQAKALAAQHEARLAEKLGPDNRKTVIDILRQFERKPAAKAHTPR